MLRTYINILTALAVLSVLVYSCGEQKQSDQETVSLIQNEIVLDHEELILSWPAAFVKAVGQDSVLTYDERNQRFTLFSLLLKKPIWSDTFDLNGPNFIEQPILDAEVVDDRMILLSPSFLTIITLNGDVQKRTDINEISGGYNEALLRNFTLLNSNKLLFPKLLRAAVSPANFSDTTSTIFLEYDLSSEKAQEWPISSPRETLVDIPEKGYYNDLAQHYALLRGDYLYYNFRFSSKVYRYNIRTQSLNVFNAKSNFGENLRTPIDKTHSTEELVYYRYSGGFFLPLHYDETTSYFIRLNSQFTKMTDGTDVLNKYLMVFDKDFNTVAEIEVPNMVFEKIQVNKGVVYLWKLNQTIENGYELFTYTIEK